MNSTDDGSSLKSIGDAIELEVIAKIPIGNAHRTPLLFVHGACHAAWCWDEYFLDYFAEHGYHVYALSLCGHGASEGKRKLQWASIEDYVTNVAQVAGTLGEMPVVIGHSMGGLVVQKYLECHCARAGVLMASVPPGSMLRGLLRVFGRYPLAMARGILTLNLESIVTSQKIADAMFFSPGLAESRAFVTRLQGESYRAFLDMLFSRPRPHLVKVPMCVLGATRDALVTPDEVADTAKAYRTQAMMFDMAHDMMLETEWLAAAECIRMWLNERGL